MSGAALRRKRGWILAALAALGVILAAGAIAIYAGVYNVAADIPHSQSVYWLLDDRA